MWLEIGYQCIFSDISTSFVYLWFVITARARLDCGDIREWGFHLLLVELLVCVPGEAQVVVVACKAIVGTTDHTETNGIGTAILCDQ